MVMNGWLHITCSERSRSTAGHFWSKVELYVENHPSHRLYLVIYFFCVEQLSSLNKIVPRCSGTSALTLAM